MAVAEKSLPKTVEEAVDHLVATLDQEEKELIKDANEANLGQFHFSLGLEIRNT